MSCHWVHCYFCNHEFGVLESWWSVRKANKPPSTPFRWGEVGACCTLCVHNNSIQIDPWVKHESKE